ncbi:MAG: hypothetical protein KC423_00780 [Anaerolineales bacterium]|nr:hypothetical protein [Anaerolineales bacterium]
MVEKTAVVCFPQFFPFGQSGVVSNGIMNIWQQKTFITITRPTLEDLNMLIVTFDLKKEQIARWIT